MKKDKENKVCIICGSTQKEHRTNLHIFSIQIGCPPGNIKKRRTKSKKLSKKTILQEPN